MFEAWLLKKDLQIAMPMSYIPMKVSSSIKMTDPKDYNEIDFCTYQTFVEKLIYFLCSLRPDIAFVVKQLGRHNANLRKRHF